MSDAITRVEEAIAAIERLRGRTSRGTSVQVTSHAELSIIKATAQAWFHSQKPAFATLTQKAVLDAIDDRFRELLDATGRATTRERYKRIFRGLRADLVRLRSLAVDPSKFAIEESGFTDPPPDFSILIPDQAMRSILLRRWEETKRCLNSEAHLAATVMMGALLEALLLARINRLSNKAPVFTAGSAPKDRKGKVKFLNDWGLKDYIDVGHEMGWIRQSGRDVGVVLRDYRNYIHPHKELSQGVVLQKEDTAMFWAVFTSLAGQIISSV